MLRVVVRKRLTLAPRALRHHLLQRAPLAPHGVGRLAMRPGVSVGLFRLHLFSIIYSDRYCVTTVDLAFELVQVCVVQRRLYPHLGV